MSKSFDRAKAQKAFEMAFGGSHAHLKYTDEQLAKSLEDHFGVLERFFERVKDNPSCEKREFLSSTMDLILEAL